MNSFRFLNRGTELQFYTLHSLAFNIYTSNLALEFWMNAASIYNGYDIFNNHDQDPGIG